MDLDLLRTFLEVSRTAHFGRAAERLHLTQSTVSARIRLLEEELGQKLFLREQGGAQLSQAGQAFSKQAVRMLALWEEARLLAQQGAASVVRLNAMVAPAALALFGALWARELSREAPQVGLRLTSQSSFPALAGEWDLSLGFEAPKGAGVEATALGELPLLLVASEADWAEQLIQIDWGAAFKTALLRRHPQAALPRWSLDQPQAALDLLQAQGGAAYLPASWRPRFAPHWSVIEEERITLIGALRKKGESAPAARQALEILGRALISGGFVRSSALD